MAGRDIGTVIFPDAKFKFFLTASLEIRAKRRFEQLKKTSPQLNYQQVLEQTKIRDTRDTNRQVSPLKVPDKAMIIDTSNKTIEETVEQMLQFITSHSNL